MRKRQQLVVLLLIIKIHLIYTFTTLYTESNTQTDEKTVRCVFVCVCICVCVSACVQMGWWMGVLHNVTSAPFCLYYFEMVTNTAEQNIEIVLTHTRTFLHYQQWTITLYSPHFG